MASDKVTGTQATQAIAVAQLHLGETVPNSNWCANFVSQVYKEAGLSSIFSATGYVPNLVGQFTGKTSTNVSSAQPGDLIIFGNNEHVMLYEGSGKVIGTATNTSTGISKVIETDWNNVYTDSGAKGPSMVIHTNLDNSAPTDNSTLATSYAAILTKVSTKSADTFTQSDLDTILAAANVVTTDNGTKLTTLQKVTLQNNLQPLVGNSYASFTIQQGFPQAFTNAGWSTDMGMKTVQDIAQTAQDALNPLGSIVDILGKFTNPANWLHLGAMLAGVALIGFGMVVVARDLGETGPQGLVSPMPIILKEGS